MFLSPKVSFLLQCHCFLSPESISFLSVLGENKHANESSDLQIGQGRRDGVKKRANWFVRVEPESHFHHSSHLTCVCYLIKLLIFFSETFTLSTSKEADNSAF